MPPPRHLSPVRIYVLWHPDFDRAPELESKPAASLSQPEKDRINRGLKMARRIYHWFRLETMEGIPVYFRSADEPGKTEPPAITRDCEINYIIPLVDANMVASPEWRSYAARFMRAPEPPDGCRTVLLPVAVDPVAYNMPEVMRKLNFIRHDMSLETVPDPEVLVSRITEIICRDLRAHLQPKPKGGEKATIPGKLKIFLSHAKADDTKEAIALKEYIQAETQCEAFFDETDIASGYNYEQVLKTAITDESAGLIVVQGDHYADRPWCRKEIRDFLKPVADDLMPAKSAPAFFVPPVVVVQIMQGKRVARTIPELGHAPCVKWQDKAARFVVTTLMREILLGLFYRMLAQRLADTGRTAGYLFVNRTPDPVMLNRILAKSPGGRRPKAFVHPGYGLSAMELQSLKEAFTQDFISFSELSDRMDEKIEGLAERIISVSVGNAQDIQEAGSGDEHNEELLFRLLRPLFREQVSLLYGGALPKAIRPLTPWEEDVNFTGTFLELLLSERSSGSDVPRTTSRLYNLSAWPHSVAITPQVKAQWNDICTFITVGPRELKIEGLAPEPKPPDAAELAELPLADRRQARSNHEEDKRRHAVAKKVLEARCLSAMRKMASNGIGPIPPGDSDGALPPPCTRGTMAHLYLGGKVTGAAGIMPGIFEEVLHAFTAKKPVFIIGAGHGAAGLIAGWLLDPPVDRPAELTAEYYKGNLHYEDMAAELAKLSKEGAVTPDQELDRLWDILKKETRKPLAGLMNNELNDDQNRALLNRKDTGSMEICRLVWLGVARLSRKDLQKK
jgi:SLOG cluster2/TIR domain